RRARERVAHAQVGGLEWYWPRAENPRRSSAPQAVRLLAPFDPVVHDRARFELLWGWTYRFEAYTPAAKRKLGYYALPLLWRDRADGAQRASARFTQGVVSFDRGKHSAVLFLNAKVARLRPLQDGVAKLAVEVEQGELSFRYDRGEKRLQHARAIFIVSLKFIGAAKGGLRVETKGNTSIRADDRLNHHFRGSELFN